jgi:drug/metabolite transporter (DMT)-like permease
MHHKDNNVKTDPVKGFLYSLGGAILVSTNFVTAKYGLRGFNPETFSLVWTTAASIFAFGIALAFKSSREQILPVHSIKPLLLLGVATGIGMVLTWSGLSKLDPVFASFIWRFLPALTILSSVVLLKERLSGREVLAMIVMLSGGLFSAIGRWEAVGAGIVLTFFAIIASTAQMLIAKLQARKVHPNVLVAYRVGVGAIVVAVWVFAAGAVDFNVEPRFWYVTLLGAFIGPCVSFYLTFRSYRYWTLSQSTLALTMQPLFVLPLAYIFLKTMPSLRELIGGAIILSGAFWLGFLHLNKKDTK